MKRAILKILRKTHLIKYLNFILSVRMRYNDKFKIPIIGGFGYDHFFEQEKWMEEVLRKLHAHLDSSTCFIDVGVNIGQTLLKVKSIDRNWAYIGFEPNPSCLNYVYQLIQNNRFIDTIILPYALSNRSYIGDLLFYNSQNIDSSASIIKKLRPLAIKSSIKIPVIDGVDAIELYSRKISLIKIDVEGGELEVLKGLLSIIKKDLPFIICEILPVYDGDNQFRLNRQLELEELMNDLGYVIYRINDSQILTLIKNIGIHRNILDTNYLFVYKSNIPLISNQFLIK